MCVQKHTFKVNQYNNKLKYRKTNNRKADDCFHNMVDNPLMADINILYFNILNYY